MYDQYLSGRSTLERYILHQCSQNLCMLFSAVALDVIIYNIYASNLEWGGYHRCNTSTSVCIYVHGSCDDKYFRDHERTNFAIDVVHSLWQDITCTQLGMALESHNLPACFLPGCSTYEYKTVEFFCPSLANTTWMYTYSPIQTITDNATLVLNANTHRCSYILDISGRRNLLHHRRGLRGHPMPCR